MDVPVSFGACWCSGATAPLRFVAAMLPLRNLRRMNSQLAKSAAITAMATPTMMKMTIPSPASLAASEPLGPGGGGSQGCGWLAVGDDRSGGLYAPDGGVLSGGGYETAGSGNPGLGDNGGNEGGCKGGGGATTMGTTAL